MFGWEPGMDCGFSIHKLILFHEYFLKKSNIKYDIRSLLLEGDNLWVGTYAEGLHVLNLKTGNIKSYTYSRDIPEYNFAVMMY